MTLKRSVVYSYREDVVVFLENNGHLKNILLSLLQVIRILHHIFFCLVEGGNPWFRWLNWRLTCTATVQVKISSKHHVLPMLTNSVWIIFLILVELTLFTYLQAIFERFDRDRSGKIDSMELKDALYSLGYAVPPSVLQVLISKYDDRSGRRVELNFDSFVE